MKHSYLLMKKLLLTLIILSDWRYWDKEYFNTTLEEYKVTSDYNPKGDFDGLQAIPL